MAYKLFIHFPEFEIDGGSTVDWLLLDQNETPLLQESGPLADIAAEIDGYSDDLEVYVFVSSSTLLLTEASLPTSQVRQIRQALPFVIEESIADDIEDVHIATPEPLPKDQLIPAAVVRHQLMVHWLDVLYSSGIEVNALIADVQAIPLQENHWTVFCTDHHLYVRTGDYLGLKAPIADAEILLTGLINDQQNSGAGTLPSILVLSSNTSTLGSHKAKAIASLLQKRFENIEVTSGIYDESHLQIMANTVSSQQPAINLLQGGYTLKKSSTQGESKFPLKAVASIAGFGLIGYLAITLLSGWYFSYQADVYHKKSVALYKELFPSQRRVVNPRKQMQNQLRSTGSVANNSAFLSLLAETAGQLNARSGEGAFTLNQLRYSQAAGNLQFEVVSTSIEQLDQFKIQLSSGGLAVDISSASEQEDSVVGRFVVGGSR